MVKAAGALARQVGTRDVMNFRQRLRGREERPLPGG